MNAVSEAANIMIEKMANDGLKNIRARGGLVNFSKVLFSNCRREKLR
jgi:hypothetical protein